MRIVVDAMGGDGAPAVEVEGAVAALRDADADLEIRLVGDEARVRAEIERAGAASEKRLSIIHAPERIEMGEDPARQVRRKKGASITVATRMLREGEADGLVSAGNTGAVVASSLLTLGRIAGVRRPAIATFLPSPTGGAVLLDVGANSDCTPQHLVQFAVMGGIFARRLLGRAEPKIGLLNIGEESSKGNKLVQTTYPLLQESPLNFVGNVVLKFSESVIHLLKHLVKEEIGDGVRNKLGALLLRPVFQSLSQQLNYEEYGGAPLLGIDGVVIIAHGSSSPRAIASAVRVAVRFARERINDTIREELQERDLGQIPA